MFDAHFNVRAHSLPIDLFFFFLSFVLFIEEHIITWNVLEIAHFVVVVSMCCSQRCAFVVVAVVVGALFCLSFNKMYRKLRYWNKFRCNAFPLHNENKNHDWEIERGEERERAPSSWCCQSKSNFLHIHSVGSMVCERCTFFLLYQPHHCPIADRQQFKIDSK